MNKSTKKLTLFAALAMAFGSTSASATFYTDLAQVLVTPSTSSPTIKEINLVTGSGETYTNNLVNNALHTGTNENIVTIGSDIITAYNFPAGGQLNPAQYNGHSIVTVFALSGQSTATTTTGAFANFTSGKLAFFELTSGSYNQYDPTTWGAVTNGINGLGLATPIAVFDLHTPDNVAHGTGSGAFNLSASQVNLSAINLATTNSQQGHFLFVPENPGPLGVNNVVPTPGLNWLTVTNPTIPGGKEGLVTRTDQSLDAGSDTTNLTINGLINSGLNILDVIGRDLGGFASLGSGHYFATSICSAGVDCTGGQQSDPFSYNIATGPSSSADIRANLGAFAAPGTIPEPGTLALLGIGLAGFGFRMRKQQS